MGTIEGKPVRSVAMYGTLPQGKHEGKANTVPAQPARDHSARTRLRARARERRSAEVRGPIPGVPRPICAIRCKGQLGAIRCNSVRGPIPRVPRPVVGGLAARVHEQIAGDLIAAQSAVVEV